MVSSPKDFWPTVRACSTAVAMSRPSVLTRATTSPVLASGTSVARTLSAGLHHSPQV